MRHEPLLRTTRTRLRPLVVSDAAALARAMADPEVMVFTAMTPHRSVPETEAWLAGVVADAEAGRRYEWAIEHRGEVVGRVALHEPPWIAYLLARHAWGKGLAHEAVDRACRYALDVLGLETVRADVDPRNDRSLALLTQLGFRETARFAATWQIDGRWQDSVIFARGRDEGGRQALAQPSGATGATGATDGTDGTDGTDATDAADGTDATDAADGTDATDATDGIGATDGTEGTGGLGAAVAREGTRRRGRPGRRPAPSGIVIAAATSASDVAVARGLLGEYAAWLGRDLSFQGFDDEHRNLPGDYAGPRGTLLVAWRGGSPLGMAACRQRGDRRAEMKRLFVRREARGLGLGRALVDAVLAHARDVGFEEIVLDTLPEMVAAHALYVQCGFVEVAPYYESPIEGTRFMGRGL
ncbi:MAG: GNAT family N-acetyltransferase [Vicinamibacterales bacterium]